MPAKLSAKKDNRRKPWRRAQLDLIKIVPAHALVWQHGSKCHRGLRRQRFQRHDQFCYGHWADPCDGDPLIGRRQSRQVQRRSPAARLESSILTSASREPSDDDLAGAEWWSALSEARQADWLRLADSTKPADAWSEYKRRTAQPEDDAAEAKSAEHR
ncbi:MAG TPA: hypothetical protein VME40_18740 [Caulobacteraceae bacterium]|nr:hypothetical protein [Caulobacteraceae bacterium]